MKRLVRLGAAASLVGGALVGSFWMGTLKVLALSPEQIIQKFRPVPVFTITNDQGAPLVAAQNGTQGGAVAGVFITQKDAQTFLDNLKTRNPDLAKTVKVVPVSLAEVYQLDQASQGKAAKERLNFAYVPSQQQVDLALTLLKQSGQKVEQFNGTPLFVARGGAEKGYLTIQQGNRAVIPMFFKKEELQSLLDRFKQQQPKEAASLEIQVLNLEGLMDLLKTKNDPQLDQIILIPPQESLDFIRSMSGKQQPALKSQPAAQPQKK